MGFPHGGKRATWLVWSASDKGGVPESPDGVSVAPNRSRSKSLILPRLENELAFLYFTSGDPDSWTSRASSSGPLSILPQASLRPRDCRESYQISSRPERIISRPYPTAHVATAGNHSLLWITRVPVPSFELRRHVLCSDSERGSSVRLAGRLPRREWDRRRSCAGRWIVTVTRSRLQKVSPWRGAFWVSPFCSMSAASLPLRRVPRLLGSWYSLGSCPRWLPAIPASPSLALPVPDPFPWLVLGSRLGQADGMAWIHHNRPHAEATALACTSSPARIEEARLPLAGV